MPFKSRLFLWFFGLLRRKHEGLPSPRELRKARMAFPRFFALNWVLGRPDRRTTWQDMEFSGREGRVKVRRYEPRQAASESNKPLILNFHGGGWAVGNLQNNDYYCSMLAAELNAIVVSVDYRLAPEHKFPCGLHDCYDALCWAVSMSAQWGADVNRVVVTGDSAGGNLSAAVCLMSRDLGGPDICFQALIYPAVDASLSFESIQIHAKAPILHKRDMQHFLAMYARCPEDLKDPYLSPWEAKSLSGMPPALIVTAGFDPLQDDGKHWAERLQKEGVEVEHLHYPYDFHGFVSIPHFTLSGKKANQDICNRINAALKR